MEQNQQVRFTLGKQSSLAPNAADDDDGLGEIDPRVRLMFVSSEGDLDGVKKLLSSGTDVNFRDIDNRTALHVASCNGFSDVAEMLINGGADVEAKDKWGSTPLADAIHYKKHDVVKLLEKHGAKHLMAPMHVNNVREIPEYEINANELDFTNSVDITKGTFTMASWRGTQVAVKKLGDELFTDDNVGAFRDELELLLKIRHPNVVQFLGAVTQSSPMMIVVEYLPKGDLRAYLKRKGPLKPLMALKYAMDIARGMSYLHENKPEPIIHRDLEPSNILQDDSGHLKVADFGVSELLKGTSAAKHKKLMTFQDTTSGRYLAPEVFRNEDYDTKVDVFSFALILQEMIEGCEPFASKNAKDVPELYAEKRRPPFNAPSKNYAHGLKELIEECWHENPSKRPPFRQIIIQLESIYNSFERKSRWKVQPLRCFGIIEAMCKGEDSNRSSHNRNILQDDSGHLKVADFGVSELLKGTSAAKHKKLMTFQDTTSGRYLAPEVFRNEDYDTKVDVFSFALILQEMIEGCEPFASKNAKDVPELYAEKRRPPFNAPSKNYAHGLKELIEECWHENPSKRPPFRQIIIQLESIYNSFERKSRWKVQPLRCFGIIEAMCKGEDSNRSSHNRSSRI